ncbi:MAG TPA: zinc ribbon domain-containing protein [Candidatus Acidoferrales bacterium]|nr:zinc ribbon domain-containing protein [Candidatus Acidoferrales bacterium]
MICPACGLALPDHARFCARCGRPLDAGRSPAATPAWVLLALGVGGGLSAAVAALYTGTLLGPDLPLSGQVDPARLRLSAILVAAAGWTLLAIQVVAVGGLLRGRAWGRIAATVVGVGWALTCVGLPLAVLMLVSLWRSPLPANRLVR